MSSLDLALAEAAAGTFGGPAALFASMATIGVLGVMDSLLGDDEELPEDEGSDGGGDIFDDDAVAGGDDEFAFDDGGGGDGQFDDFDVDGMDDEDGGAAEGSMVEIEGRVDEIEAELESLSSTVSTVRTENEQIGESVEGVEENVRKLLEIYKMVTKGVNPFVDDGGDQLAAPGEGALGLFDDEDDAAADEDLDEEVADADAEEFFDDDLEDDEAEFADEAEIDDEYEEEAEAVEDADEEDEDEAEESTGGKSFDDLREEYEGESEWSEDDLEGDAADDQLDDAADDATASTEKPYLEELPAGYVTDLLVTEWIEFLVAESSTTGAARAITYYENVEWIDRRAADQLREFLAGHPASDGQEADGGALTMDHHTASLQYVAKIRGDHVGDVPAPRRQERTEEVVLQH